MTGDSPGERPGKALLVFLGWALMGIGVLIGTLSGLCTCLFLVAGAFAAFQKTPGSDSQDTLALALYSGVPAILLGAGIFFLGRLIVRRAER